MAVSTGSRTGSTSRSATGPGGMFGGGASGPKSSTAGRAPGASAAAAKASAAKSSTGRAPAASAAAAKATATKAPAKTTTAGRAPGTSAAAAKNTALGKAAQVAKQNVAPSRSTSGTSTQWGGRAMSSPQTAPNGSYYGPKGGGALNTDARLAAARSVGFSQPAIGRTPGDAQMLGRMMMAESGTIKNQYGLPRTVGLQGVADVVRNRVLSNQFPNTVPGVLTQRKQFSPIADGSFARTPANPMATRVAEAILSGEQPPVVGNALNYANIHTVNTKPGYSSAATRRAFNSMAPTARIADAQNPVSRSHTFGTIGRSDVAFGGPPAYSPGVTPATQRPTQIASNAPAAAAEAARIQRRDAALQTLAGGLTPPAPRPQARPFSTGPWQGAMPGVVAPMRDDAFAQPFRPSAPVPNMRPLQSFVGGDPRANMPPGAYPQARMQSPVMSDPRVGMPPGAFPAAPVRFAPTGDPRVNMAPGSYPPARMQSQIMGDPRANIAPSSYPAAKPASVFGDPRVAATPLGRFPAAERPRLTMPTDPRVGMTPGAYPAAALVKDQSRIAPTFNNQMVRPQVPGSYPAAPAADPQANLGFAGMPPMGGALPPDMAKAFGEWGITRTPPAAPNQGTIHSQTAEVQETAPSFWQQGTDLFKQATTAVDEKLKEHREANETYGPETVLKVIQQQAGILPKSLTDPGSGRNPQQPMMASYGGAGGGGSSGPDMDGDGNVTLPELQSFKVALQAAGASPEDIAYVQQLIDAQTARA